MKMELSPSDLDMRHLNKKVRVTQLPPTTPALMTDVKMEDVMAEKITLF